MAAAQADDTIVQLQQYFQQLTDESAGPNDTAALKLVRSIVKNLVAHPGEEKYLKLRLNGKAGQKITASPAAVSYLQTLGFTRSADNEFFQISPDHVVSLVNPQVASQIITTAHQILIEPSPSSIPHAQPVSADENFEGMSLKQKARRQKEIADKKAREKAILQRKAELAKIKQDAFVRQNDENWSSGVSSAAGKGGKSIGTFREKFGEDQGGG
eukprot:CAMPEP_0185766756 /NCGR_PEP_ID=MMETSP1174-20130828/38635_1 /TAXON_ID=35687 /ORGANISM="Dictyocha speculum, Strain CCMP1381" /LENGTH=213 /DNA_ID=CAMNT_0028450573 /DNA_START=58 /DNA_END=699 /DNA_ORIENTATION=-